MKRTKALESTAHHEAGHAVAAIYVQIEPKAVTIIPNDGYSGLVSLPAYFSDSDFLDLAAVTEFSPELQRKVENSVLISFAGPQAQKYFNPKGFRSYHAEKDYECVVELLFRLEQDQDVLKHYFRMLDCKARNFVRSPNHWKAICDLAKALLAQPKMSGREVRETVLESYRVQIPRLRQKAAKA